MHIQSISVTIPRETLASFLREARFPEGIALTDFVLGEGAIVLVLKIASYFGIPVRVKLELDSFHGSRIIFKATPPIRFPTEGIFDLAPHHEPEAVSRSKYTLAEMDLLKLSKGLIRSATISRLSITKRGFSLEARDIQADPHKILAAFQNLSPNHK